jgi:hypothetical protein
MNAEVQREKLTEHSTIGRMRILDVPDFSVYTLEPPKRTDGSKPRAIDAGTYELTIRYSQKHGRLIPHVEGVPDFTEIEIHIGNFAVPHPDGHGQMKPPDTEGCTCVGRTNPSPDFIGASHAAFDDLFDRLFAAAAENHGGPPDVHMVYHVGFITYKDPGVAA